MVGGLASAVVLFGYAWWAPLVLGGRLAGDALAAARERGLARPQHRRGARGAARRRLRLPAGRRSAGGQGAAAVRPGRLDDRPLRRPPHALHELQYEATRLRERPVLLGACCSSPPPTSSCSGRSPTPPPTAGSTSAEVVVFAQAAVGASMIAFGGLNWALDGAAAPVAAVLRLEPAMAPGGGRAAAGATARPTGPAGARSASATSPSPTRAATGPVLDGFDLTIPAGSSLAIVGQNGAGKTTLAKLLCRLYDPQAGAIEVDGVDLRELDLDAWRGGVTAVFQDFIRFELPLRDNVAPGGAPDDGDPGALAEPARARPGRPRHGAGPGLRGRHRPLRRPVAAGRAGPRAVRRAARRRRRAARRADRPARRARRGRDLRAHPRRDPPLHDDPHLAPVLDRAPRRPHLRARARPGRRARHATTS